MIDNLIAANRGSRTQLEAGQLAQTAFDIATGKLPVQDLPVLDKSGRQVGTTKGVVLPNGVKLRVDPAYQPPAAAPRAAPGAVPSFPGAAPKPQSAAAAPAQPTLAQSEFNSDPLVAGLAAAAPQRAAEQQRVLEVEQRPGVPPGGPRQPATEPRPDPGLDAAARAEALQLAERNGATRTPAGREAIADLQGLPPADTVWQPRTQPPARGRPAPQAGLEAATPRRAASTVVSMPAADRAAKQAELRAAAAEQQAIITNPKAGAKQKEAAIAKLREIRAQAQELAGTPTDEAAALQRVILDRRSTPAEVAEARARLREMRQGRSELAGA